MTTTREIPAQDVADLAALVTPYLVAAMQRFGSLEAATDHVVALLAADASA